MKRIVSNVFLIILLSSIVSCYTIEKARYGNEIVQKIKSIKENKNYTFISYQIPKFENDRIRKYQEKEIRYKFKAKKFKNGEAVFALIGQSTRNYGTLELINGEERIPIDSATCKYGEFIFLKLNPVKKGNYKIKGSGCRYGKEFEITIE